MKENIINKKEKLLFLAITSLVLLLIIFLSLEGIVEKLNIAEQSYTAKMEEKNTNNDDVATISSSDEMCKFLSDIEYDKEKSSVGWGSITLDSNLETQYNNGLITLIVEGKNRQFLKGISAHANSTLIYDISKYSFDKFTAYVGVDQSRADNGNGVKFQVFTSENGTDWDLKKSSSKALKGTDNAEFFEVELNGAKFLKLVCDQNGNNASDHSVWASAKLIKNGYVETEGQIVDFIKTVEEYDNELKNLSTEQQIGEKEHILLKREFVKNVGYDLLQSIVGLDTKYKDAVEWLMNDKENLKLYVLGGAPDGGSYYNSIKELSKLLEKYKGDFDNQEKTGNKWNADLTKGEVYKKMVISLSLTHATKVGYWAQIDHPSNRSDSGERYRIYKELYDGNKFKVSDNQDQTDWYEALTVEEMRYVMNNITDDEELIWFNEYTQTRINNALKENPKANPETYLQPHTYIAYVWPDFENPIFHSQNEKDKKYWDDLFDGIFTKYKVTYSTEKDHVYKAWMSMRNKYGTGAVCGGISKLGCHIRAAHGTPASVICQPGHAAIIYYRKYDDGKGYWSMDNDVSGWALSGASEKMQVRMPLGWGNESFVSNWQATYIHLSQTAINDEQNRILATEINMTADLYKEDAKKQQEIYKKALEKQKINLDSWWGLINAYKADDTKKEEDYYNLASELGEALKPFPLPMKDLLNQIKDKFTSVEYKFKYGLLEGKLLNEGKVYEATDVVLQPSITRTEATYLLGQTDTTLATFSFDGEDAGKIVLSNRFDDTGVRWDYSLDGKKTWKEKSFNADEVHKLHLTADEINSITAENDIYIHIVGTDRENEANLYKIDIQEGTALKDLYANDLENRVVGINMETSEWRYTENDSWTPYSKSTPDLTGDKTIQVREGPKGTKLAGPASEMYKFTQDNQPEDRKYIMVSELSIKDYSSQSKDSSRPFYAPCAIDGNIHTLWHTDFAVDIRNLETNPYIVIELDEPKYISALEFIQTKYKQKDGTIRTNDPDVIKNATVYVSSDEIDEEGEDGWKADKLNWTEAGKIENCTEYGKLESIEFKESIKCKYIKLELNRDDMFTSIAMLNLFEDTTKIDKTKPTAGIYYSTTEKTSDYVIAKLVNPSTEIEITNNGGSDTYIFKDNDEFTFEFKDKNGNVGTAIAKVTWIDKKGPEAEVDYELKDNRLSILLDSISEDVYLLDEEDRKTNYIEVEDGKVKSIQFLDGEGDVYKTAEIDQTEKDEEHKEITYKKITYKNTTGRAENVAEYVTTFTDGKMEEEFLNENGESVEVSDEDKEVFRRLQQVKTNPLEYTFEDSGDYQFKFLDKASNIAFKSIKVDYLESGNVMASDMSYDITNITNQNVVATIKPYMLTTSGKKEELKIANKDTNTHTFEKNGAFTFQYKDANDDDNIEVKEHEAKVNWIDKEAPTATIVYSTEDETTGAVTASLVDESEKIVITNNGTNRDYTFDKNGTFTFEFEDTAGNLGTAVAKVDWIKEETDTPDNPDTPDEIVVGDANSDGEISATDILWIKRHLIAGDKKEWILTDDKFKAGDINKDNKITATDLLLMKRLVLKQINEE